MVTMNSHKTAIARKTLPVPTRWLLKQGMIHGHVLDFGCGKCAEVNQTMLRWRLPEVKSVTSYDPFFAPNAIKESGRLGWDVVLCNYVLCTLPPEEESKVLKDVQSHLLPNGVAFISVRADVPKGGYGVSSKGTFQRRVEMPFLYQLRETSQYRIYLLTPDFKLI